jgi:hypothetical protein
MHYSWGTNKNILYALESYTKDDSIFSRIIGIDRNQELIKIIIEGIRHSFLWEIRCSPSGTFLAGRFGFSELTEIMQIYLIDLVKNEMELLIRHPSQLYWGEMSWTEDSKSLLYGCWDEDQITFTINLIFVESGIKQVISKRAAKLAQMPGPLSHKSNELILYSDMSDTDIWLLGEN